MTDMDESVTTVLENGCNTREPAKTYTLDTVFKNLGDCGPFQVIFVSVGYFPLLPAAWTIMLMFFVGYNPGWTCQDTLDVNANEFIKRFENMSLPATHDEQSLSGNETRFSSCDAMRLCENVTFNGGVSTVVTEWGLVCDDAWIFPLIFVIHMSGLIFGSCASGCSGDNLGRKFSIHGSAALLVITHIIAIFSVSWEMYAVFAFICGIGCGGILSSVLVYTCEFIPGWWRGCIGSFPFWNISTMTFGLCVMVFKNWKHVHIATAVVSLLAFLPVFWLPESLRFLAVHGKPQRGHLVMQKIAKLNRKPVPDTSIMTIVAQTEREIMKTRTRYTYWDLFNKNVRKYSIVMGIAWVVLSVESYMIGFGLNELSGDYFVNFILFTSISIPMRLLAPVIATKWGRKYASTILVFLSTVCTFILVTVELWASEPDKGTVTRVFAFGRHMLMESAWGPVVVLGVELFPTGFRNLSFSYSNILGRIGSMISPYLIRKEIFPIYGSYLLLGFLQIVFLIALLTIPETKDKPLPDNSPTNLVAKKKRVHTEQF